MNPFSLEGKTALVTGATGDIGEAIARKLHMQGASVLLTGRREERLKELAKALGERSAFLALALEGEEAPERLMAACEEHFSAFPHILVNNAGVTDNMLALRMKAEKWRSVLETNLTSAFRLSQAALKGMMKARWGRIISISSVVGTTGNTGQAAYAASKAGLAGFTKSLAQELATRNITVNCIAPGFISSAMTSELNEKQREGILAKIPVQRLGKGEDIANAALYLSSEEAGYVTGQTLHVNGGMLMV